MSAQRQRLPDRRRNETLNFVCNGLRYVATFGFFENGDLAEVFLSNAKVGSHSDAAARDAAIITSIGLQHGVPVDAIRHAVLRDQKGIASSPIGMVLDLIVTKGNDGL
jgi:hypothetical protein